MTDPDPTAVPPARHSAIDPFSICGKLPLVSPFTLKIRGMLLHPLSLAFTGAHAKLESAFHNDYLENSLWQIRVVLVLAATLYATFGILDALLIPDYIPLTWTIRFGIVCPAVLGLALGTRYKAVQRRIQPLLAGVTVLAGVGIIVMILIAPPPVNYSYYAGLILVFIFGYTFARMRFVWATAAAWCVVVLYEIAAIALSDTPFPVLVNNNFFFISANLIGMLACYAMELYARRDFFMVQRLGEEQEKVQAVNRELEQRVRARTTELEQMNADLKVEIRERRRAEAERLRLATQLQQAEKMEAIGTMAAGVAHDLNNILSGLVSYPDLILMDLPENSPLWRQVLTIKQSGERAAAIVQELLTLARRDTAHMQVLDPCRLVMDFFDSPEFHDLRRAHEAVRFRHNLEPDLLNVRASAVHLTKTLTNLAANAAEAELVGGEVAISAVNRYVDRALVGFETIPEGEYVLIRVRDTGIGISPDDLPRIFEPFFTKKRLGRSGTGLGMALVWTTVKNLGGFIDIDSREGEGTTISLYLPATREAVSVRRDPVSVEDYRGYERILVVDDVAAQRKIAAAMLGKLGYRVSTAASGDEALAHLEKYPTDLLVLDMIMEPGMDGCETYRRAIERHPGQKAIIASGFSESDRVREVLRLGAGAYVKKPYTMETIAKAIRHELDRG